MSDGTGSGWERLRHADGVILLGLSVLAAGIAVVRGDVVMAFGALVAMAGFGTMLSLQRRDAQRTDAPSSDQRDDAAMSDVHQCPFCELRFVNLAELQFHIQLDHPDREVPEREY